MFSRLIRAFFGRLFQPLVESLLIAQYRKWLTRKWIQSIAADSIITAAEHGTVSVGVSCGPESRNVLVLLENRFCRGTVTPAVVRELPYFSVILVALVNPGLKLGESLRDCPGKFLIGGDRVANRRRQR